MDISEETKPSKALLSLNLPAAGKLRERAVVRRLGREHSGRIIEENRRA
jgi:hypothetical protein